MALPRAWIAAVLAAFAAAPSARADGPAAGQATPGDYTPETAAAATRGLSWLAQQQRKNGSWGMNVPVATTSIAGLALLANGNVPGRGRYGENVKHAVRYLLSCQKDQGRRGFIGEPQGGSRMHGHGYATLFLAEVLGMTNDGTEGLELEELKEAVRKAVDVIEKSQSQQGGWYYEPVAGQDEGSVTVTQVQALRSARNAGIGVSKTTIDQAVKYMQKSANDDGGIRYSLAGGRGGDSSFALTAAGVSVMNYLGEYSMPEIDKGLKYLEGCMKGTGRGRGRGSYVSYETFYATLAFWHAGGERWAKFWPVLRNDILKRQSGDGSWPDPQFGSDFGTAFATVTLQVPNQYLPIFQH